MNRLAKWVPAIAVALTIPAWAIAPSTDTKQDAATTASQQAAPASSSSTDGDQGKAKAHGPTAIMDRATPAEKSKPSSTTDKHPPTARMDRSTPNQKSPTTKSGGDTESNDQGVSSTAK
jgi:hypothetical protein